MTPTLSRAIAVLEVIFVRFAFIPFLYWGINALVPWLEEWQVGALRLPFPVLHHLLMMVVPLLILLACKKDLRAYGMTFRNLKYHTHIAGVCFIPFVLASLPFGMGVDYRDWSGAILLAVIQIALLFAVGWLLKAQPSGSSLGVLGGWTLLAIGPAATGRAAVGEAFATFVTYAIFVGFGEEMVYRGYIQSRLNEVFGCPYRFFGVKYGWGVVIASALFGFTHVGFLSIWLGISSNLTWAWGFWTFFAGLVLGLVREKSGSIVAPALLHGLPQAIASAAMLLM